MSQMNAIFSFRTLPALMREDNEWRTPKHMMLAICLAIKQAQQNIGPVHFYVDDFGAKFLELLPVKGFTIHNVLNEFSEKFPIEMYTISKIHVYSLQRAPFIHIDFDAFVLQNFQAFQSPVFGMFKEATIGNDYYTSLDQLIEKYSFTNIPPSWNFVKEEYGTYSGFPCATNAGALGGTDMEYWAEYCNETLGFLHANVDKFKDAGRPAMKVLNLSIEQYTVNSLCAYRNIIPQYLFPEGNFSPWNNTFPHMLSYEKQNISSIHKLEKLIQFLYGELFDVEAATKLWVTESRKY